MRQYLRFVTVAAVLMALVVCAPVQAQTPEVDALRARAARGDAEAQLDLGTAYFNGDLVRQDYAEAARWYRLAAEQGYADAQTDLAFVLSEGLGVSQDLTEAAHFYRLAAEQGDFYAQYNLSIMYETGRGVQRDMGSAVLKITLPHHLGCSS